MKTIKTKILFIVQGQVNGKKFYDISAHQSKSAAEKVLHRILKNCYPQWRGMDTAFRVIRRIETVTTDSEICVFSSTPRGTKRLYLAELFVPNWLPKSIQKRFKELPIPGKKP